MEARYTLRKSQLLDECQVAPEIFEQVLPRLEAFMKPFVRIFHGQVAEQHAKTYVYGLLSQVERKIRHVLVNFLYFVYSRNMEEKHAIKAFAALAQEHRLKVFRLLVRQAPQACRRARSPRR